MENELIRYISLVARRYFKLLLLAALLSALVTVVWVNRVQIPYTASANIFLGNAMPTGSTIVISGSNNNTHTTEILMQESLLRSFEVYSRVLEQVPELAAARLRAENRDLSLRQKISQIMFGGDYVVNLLKHTDFAYQSFVGGIGFRSEIAKSSFTISYTHLDPDVAIQVLEVLKNELIQYNSEIANQRNLESELMLGQKIEELKDDLRKESHGLQQFIRENELFLSPELVNQEFARYLQSLNELEKVKIEIGLQEASIDQYQRQLKNLGRNMSPQSLHPAAQRRHDQKVQDLMTVRDYRGFLSDIRRKVFEGEGQIASLKKNAALRNSLVYQQKDRLQKAQEIESQISIFLMERNQLADLIGALTQKYYELSTSRDTQLSRLLTIDKPRLVTGSLQTSKPKLAILSLASLFTLSLLLLCLYHYSVATLLDRRVLMKQSMPTYLGASKWISVENSIESAHRLSKEQNFKSSAQTLLRLSKAKMASSVVSDLGASVIGLTSSQSGSGKSVTALALFMSFVRQGYKVALFDADYRLTEGRSSDKTERDTLVGELQNVKILLPQSLRVHREKGLDPAIIIRVSAKGRTEQQMLSYLNQSFPGDLQMLKSQYDFVIIDGPPTGISDSAFIVGQSDSLIVCCREGFDRITEIEETIHFVDHHRKPTSKVFTLMTNVKISSNLVNIRASSYYKGYVDDVGEAA